MMRKGVTALAVTALVSVTVLSPAWAQDLTKDVINLDFSDTATAAQMQLNGDAAFVMEGGKQRLRLTSDGSQSASAFVKAPQQLSDYLATFDFEVRPLEGDDNAEGGFLFLAQTAGPDAIGDTGIQNLGFTRGTQGGPGTAPGQGFAGYSYGLEFCTIDNQGFVDKPDTVALDLMGTRTKFGIKPFNHVGLGVLRAQVRVTPNQLTLTISGGKANMAPQVVFTSPAFIGNDFFKAPKPLYFGFTGGADGGQITDVLSLRIQTAAAF